MYHEIFLIVKVAPSMDRVLKPNGLIVTPPLKSVLELTLND